jgi:hypothetical protein
MLKEIEEKTGRPIVDLVDLMAGTSTGGILATGLSRTANGPFASASNLLDLYVGRGTEIFARGFGHQLRTARGVIDEKYPARGLQRLATEIVGHASLDDLTSNLLVTAYDTENRKPFYFGAATCRTLDPVSSKNFRLVDVVRATSAAPTYFEAALVRSDDTLGKDFSLIDGGVFANNPAAVAYAFARCMFPTEDEIHVISLGTGLTQRPLDHDAIKDWGLIEWARPVLSVLMDGVADAVNDQLTTVLGTRYWRFDTHLKHVDDTDPAPNDNMDDASRENVQKLQQRGHYLVRQESARIDELIKFLQKPR